MIVFEKWEQTVYNKNQIINTLPMDKKPLDSPQILFKSGVSYDFTKIGTFVSLDATYNNAITMLTATNWNLGDPDPRKFIADANGMAINNPNYNPNAPDYIEYKVPASFYMNLVVQKYFKTGGLRGFAFRMKVENLLNSDVWYVLVSDAQNWDANTYYKPNQLPGFGRRFSFTMSYSFWWNVVKYEHDVK